MKPEAVQRMKSMLIPKVTIQSIHETSDEIIAEVRHAYYFPERESLPAIPWSNVIRVKADKDGNVFSTEGLF